MASTGKKTLKRKVGHKDVPADLEFAAPPVPVKLESIKKQPKPKPKEESQTTLDDNTKEHKIKKKVDGEADQHAKYPQNLPGATHSETSDVNWISASSDTEYSESSPPPSPSTEAQMLTANLRTACPSVSIVNPAVFLGYKQYSSERNSLPSYTKQVLYWFHETVELGVKIIPHSLKVCLNLRPASPTSLTTHESRRDFCSNFFACFSNIPNSLHFESTIPITQASRKVSMGPFHQNRRSQTTCLGMKRNIRTQSDMTPL